MAQDKTYPKLCMDCKHANIATWKEKSWSSRCYHPKVISTNAWALSNNLPGENGEGYGVRCLDERNNHSWFAKCGMKGKLFEPKVANPTSMDLARWQLLSITNKVEQEMIQMRWLTIGEVQPKLQYRTVKNYLELGLHLPIWTEWEDVPTVYTDIHNVTLDANYNLKMKPLPK